MNYKTREPYDAKSDTREWLKHKLVHKSWEKWRKENPEKVSVIKKDLINNSAIAEYYAIRQKIASLEKRNQIVGSLKSKTVANSVKKKYGKVIKKLGST